MMPGHIVLSMRHVRAASIRTMNADKEQRRRTGSRIRQAREQQGWSQGELARRFPPPVDGNYIGRWERGQNMPSWPHLRALAQVLGVSVGWLVDDDDEEPERVAA